MDWLAIALAAVKAAPSIEKSVLALIQMIHNELTNGSGQTNPLQVASDLLSGGSDIVAAVKKNTVAAEHDEEQVVQQEDESQG